MKKALNETKSCPIELPCDDNDKKSIRNTISYIKYSNNSSTSGSIKLPPNFRDSLRKTSTGTASSGHLSVELPAPSSTSHSVFHGCVLVLIMITSLISFICTKIKHPCEYSIYFKDCALFSLLFYSIIMITSCLTAFVIYFLHLIGQCDVSWWGKRKIVFEVVIIAIVIALISASIGLTLINTNVVEHVPGIIGLIAATVSLLSYVARFTLILHENFVITKCIKQQQLKKLQESFSDKRQSRNSTRNGSLPKGQFENGMIVVSYKRQSSLTNDSHPLPKPARLISIDESEMESVNLDDDVFV